MLLAIAHEKKYHLRRLAVEGVELKAPWSTSDNDDEVGDLIREAMRYCDPVPNGRSLDVLPLHELPENKSFSSLIRPFDSCFMDDPSQGILSGLLRQIMEEALGTDIARELHRHGCE